MTRICCVRGCNIYYYPGCDHSMFSFPSDDGIRKKWAEVIPFKPITAKNKALYICSIHFKSNDISTFIKRRQLKPEAVPSIFPNEFVPEKRINVLNTIILKPTEENIQPGSSTSPKDRKPLSSVIIEEKENLCTVIASTSMEPPLKKARKDEVNALRDDKKKLQYKMKLLKQRVKRREKVIENLKSTLGLIIKKM